MSETGRSEPSISVFVVEDHVMVAQGLLALLAAEEGIEVTGHAGDLAHALTAVLAAPPDVVLMDFRLPDGDGVDGTRRIKADHPEVQVVMLTGAGDDAVLAAAVEAGCSGFVTKDGRFSEVIRSIRAAARGDVVIPPDRMPALLSRLTHDRVAPGGLTGRELEVLQLLAGGASTSDIVDRLVLSPHTVRNHVRNILNKLDAHSKLQAVAIAAREGIIAIDAPKAS